jgi:hypothetical protein
MSSKRSRPRAAGKSTEGRRWSGQVTERSDALDLEPKVFTLSSSKRIASSLKRSAERSQRRKSDPYRSAMSMLSFYINRGGQKLSAARKATLESAKEALRALFGRRPPATKSTRARAPTRGRSRAGRRRRRAAAT